MSIAMLEHQGPWTFEEFVQLEGEHGERFELVDGALIVSPPPPVFHQAVARRLFLQRQVQTRRRERRRATWRTAYSDRETVGESGRDVQRDQRNEHGNECD